MDGWNILLRNGLTHARVNLRQRIVHFRVGELNILLLVEGNEHYEKMFFSSCHAWLLSMFELLYKREIHNYRWVSTKCHKWSTWKRRLSKKHSCRKWKVSFVMMSRRATSTEFLFISKYFIWCIFKILLRNPITWR